MEDNKAVDKQGINFSVEESAENEAKDKKKTKTTFKSLLSKLWPQDIETTDEKDKDEASLKTNRLRGLFRNPFKSLVSLEPLNADGPSDELISEGSDSDTVHEYSFPLLDKALINGADQEIVPPQDNYLEDKTLPMSEAVLDFASDMSPAENTEPIERPEATDLGQSLPEELDTERSAQETGNLVFSVEQESHEPEEKVVYVNQKSGNGAALLGFVAAETLSRHRDKKIRQEAHHLKEQVKKFDTQHQNEEQKLERAVSHNREQLANLRMKRELMEREPEIQKPIEVPRDNREKPEPKERFEVVRPEINEKQPYPVSEKVTEQAKVSEVPTREKTESRSENLVLQQAENAAERDVALEAYYERMHEAKDVPTSAAGDGSSRVPVTNSSTESSNAEEIKHQAHQLLQEQQAVQQSRDLYQNAAKRGVWAGIAVLIVFMVGALLWSLL